MSSRRGSVVRRHPLTAYFVLAYAITWVLLLPLVLSSLGVVNLRLPMAWHATGALGPFLAALVVTQLLDGPRGVRDWWSHVVRWRVGARWWWFALGSPVALLLVSAVIARLGGAPWPDVAILMSPRYANWPWLTDVLFVGTVAYGIGEEPGWRGFALPRLQKHHGSLVATLMLTPLWAVWHTPAFFYRPSYQGGLPTIIGFLFGLLAGAIVLTYLYDRTKGSVLIVIVWHILINVAMQLASVVSQPTLAVMNVLVAIGALAIVGRWLGTPRRRPVPAFGPGSA